VEKSVAEKEDSGSSSWRSAATPGASEAWPEVNRRPLSAVILATRHEHLVVSWHIVLGSSRDAMLNGGAGGRSEVSSRRFSCRKVHALLSAKVALPRNGMDIHLPT
jgi:hypothetical protein